MAAMIQWLDKALYPRYAANWDDERLRMAILGRLRPDMVILDIGAGAGHVTQMNFRGLASRVVGIDPDPRVRENRFLDEAHQGLADRLPFADESFDLVLSDNVLEHLEEPDRVFSEIARVLKPGGYFLAKTPNRTHYMTVIARLTPVGFHRLINRLRGRPVTETFPTRYRVNSPIAVRRASDRCGLRVASITLIEGRPEYLRFNPLTYIVGWLYERIVNSTEMLANFRILLLIELQKPLRV